MSRKAVLVEASKIAGADDLPGARADVVNLREWLTLNQGGAWEDEEIVVLRNPSRARLWTELEKARSVDYAFVAFSGHGHHVRTRQGEETYVCINDTEEFAAGDLYPGNLRATVLVDACRGLTVRMFHEALEARAKALKYARSEERYRCRLRFDQAVAACDAGPVWLYSCRVNESAGDTPMGGVFTTSMIRTSRALIEAMAVVKVIDVAMSFNAAATATNRFMAQQHPEFVSPPRTDFYPFAVKA